MRPTDGALDRYNQRYEAPIDGMVSMTREDSTPFEVGDKLQIAEELREGDLISFERLEPGQVKVEVVRLGDLDPDRRELFRVHSGQGGPEFIPVRESFEDLLAWERLRHLGAAAEDKGSNWGRFAIPMEALVIYAPSESLPPKRTLEDIDMPEDARASLEGYLLLSGKIPPPAEPLRVLAGVRLHPGQISETSRNDVLQTMFETDSTLELRGVLSASAATEPPLFAAGIDGLMMDILIHDAAFMSRVTGFKREAEFALPLDCRCRVTSFEPGATHEVTGGHVFHRPTLRLEQLDSPD